MSETEVDQLASRTSRGTTGPNVVIEELVQIVSRWQPDFVKKILGAPVALINQLEARLVAPLSSGSLPQDFVVLPPEHRAFLERMGENSDGINSYGDDVIDLRCSALLKYLDDPEAGFELDPRQFVLAGSTHECSVYPLLFDRRSGAEPVPLIRFGGFDEDNDNRALAFPEHPSFVAMLFTFAFMRKCLPRFPWERPLESSGTKPPQFPNCAPGRWLPHFGVIIGQLGFKPIPHTGPWSICAERRDAAVMMYECPGFTPDVRVAAQDRDTLNNLVEILCDNLEMFPRFPLRKPA